MKYLGELELLASDNAHKKVLLVMVYIEQFKCYHADDIGIWYFDWRPVNYILYLAFGL